MQSFRSAWENLQRKTENSNANSRANINSKSENSKTNISSKSEISPQWTGEGGAELGKVFAARKFSSNELEAVTRVFFNQ